MQTTVMCSQCDLPEGKCKCDRYCCYCQGQEQHPPVRGRQILLPGLPGSVRNQRGSIQCPIHD